AARLKDLRPDTVYRCRILAPDGQLVTWVRFRTAPEVDASFLFTVVGDSGHGGLAARAIARRIRAAHPAFLIHVGDLAYPDGTVDELAATFFRPYRETLRRVPLFPTPGNHDLHARSGYRAAFAPLAEGPNGDRLRYSFDWGPAHFRLRARPGGAGGGPGPAGGAPPGRPRPLGVLFLARAALHRRQQARGAQPAELARAHPGSRRRGPRPRRPPALLRALAAELRVRPVGARAPRHQRWRRRRPARYRPAPSEFSQGLRTGPLPAGSRHARLDRRPCRDAGRTHPGPLPSLSCPARRLRRTGLAASTPGTPRAPAQAPAGRPRPAGFVARHRAFGLRVPGRRPAHQSRHPPS